MMATPETPTRRATLSNVMQTASRLDDGTTPMKELFVKAGKECGVGKKRLGNMMGFSNRVWKGALKHKRGRQVGFRLLTDDRILELIDPYLHDSSRWSRRTGRPLRTLNMSKKRLFMQLPEIHKVITFVTFAKKLAKGRLGVGIGSKRVDVCDYCAWFDRKLAKGIAPLLRRTRASIKVLDTTFWMAFDAMVAAHPEYSKKNFIEAESVGFLRAWRDHLAVHGVPHVNDAVKAIVEDALLKLNGGDDEEAGFIAQLEACCSHWKLRDHQQAALREDVHRPVRGCLYLQWDFGERGANSLELGFGPSLEIT